MDQILKSSGVGVQASGGNGDVGEQRLRSGFAGGVGVERPTEGVSVRVDVNSESQPAQRVPGGVPSGRERLRDVHCVRLLQTYPTSEIWPALDMIGCERTALPLTPDTILPGPNAFS